jgi:hypothetical protein
LNAAAAARIAVVIDGRAAALRAATTPQALRRGPEETQRRMDGLRDALDALEAALTLSAQEWDRANEPTLDDV